VNGGSSWVNVETTSSSNASWQEVSVTLSGLGLAPSNAVRLRFIATDEGFGGSIVEAGVDDLQIFADATVAVEPNVSIGLTRLLPLAPNPFRADAFLRFELASRSELTLNVYDVQGRLVQRLVNGALGAGMQTARWDGRTVAGAAAAPGVYYVRLETPQVTSVQKVVRTR
jgi:hypothetical protein